MGSKIDNPKMAQKKHKNGSTRVPKNARFCDANLADVIIVDPCM